MLRIIYITGLLIASITNANKQNINKEIKEENPEDFLCSAPFYDYSEYWYGYERLLRTIIHDYDNLTPSYITFAKDIEFVVLGKTVTYIDFISDDGFVVLDKDTIYEYEKNIDLSKIHGSDFAYDPYDKFILKNERGGYERIFGENYDVLQISDLPVDEPPLCGGQNEPGDGEIYGLDEYVSDKYPGYVLEQISYLREYKPSHQFDTSIYYQDRFEVIEGVEESASLRYGEGNCTINATYSILSNLRETIDNSGVHRQYCPNFPSQTSYFDYSVDVHDQWFCETYVDGDSSAHTQYLVYDNNNNVEHIYNCYWSINTYRKSFNSNLIDINNIPCLFLQLYEDAWQYGYRPNSGMNSSYVEDIIQDIDGQYGYDIDMLNNSSMAMAIQNVNYGIPSYIEVHKSQTYRNHAMSVYGYAIYKLANSNSLDYRYFLMVDSGHTVFSQNGSPFYDNSNNKICWYDPNVIQNDGNPESFIWFSTIYKESIGWPLC